MRTRQHPERPELVDPGHGVLVPRVVGGGATQAAGAPPRLLIDGGRRVHQVGVLRGRAARRP